MMNFFFRKKVIPDFYQQYLDKFDGGDHSDMVLALDFETTSINVKKAQVLSFGAVKVSSNDIIPHSEVHEFFEVDDFSAENTYIHEVFHQNRNLQRFETYIPNLLAKLSNHTLLGHYIQYDLSIINNYLRKAHLPPIKNKTIDTLELALKMDKVRDLSFAKREDYTLYNLCKRFDIDVHTTHDALEDAYLTSLLYLHMR